MLLRLHRQLRHHGRASPGTHRMHRPSKWGEHQETAFKAIKTTFSEETTTAYFDPEKVTTIVVDASPVGLAGILMQQQRSIAFRSRSLTPVEKRYSQTEREALAVVCSLTT